MSVDRFPTGNELIARVFFAVRELTDAEEDAFFEGRGLPSGVGFDPHTVIVNYVPYEGELTKLEGAAVVKDGVGAYHVILLPEDEQAGQWRYQGRGLNAEGKPVNSTPLRTFIAYQAL